MPRQTDYTQEIANKILASLRVGATRKASYGAVGISHSTFYTWLKAFPAFLASVLQAEDVAELNYTTTLAQAASGKVVKWEKETINPDGSRTIEREFLPADWRAGLEWLKRRRRVDYGDSIDVRKIDDDTLLRLILKAQETGDTSLPSETDRLSLEPFIDAHFEPMPDDNDSKDSDGSK